MPDQLVICLKTNNHFNKINEFKTINNCIFCMLLYLF